MSIRDEVNQKLEVINNSKNISIDTVKQKYISRIDKYLDDFFDGIKKTILHAIDDSKATISNVDITRRISLTYDSIFYFDSKNYNDTTITTDFYGAIQTEAHSFFYRELKIKLPYHISLFIDMLIERTKKFDSKSTYEILPETGIWNESSESRIMFYGTLTKEKDRYTIVFRRTSLLNYYSFEQNRNQFGINIVWKYKYII